MKENAINTIRKNLKRLSKDLEEMDKEEVTEEVLEELLIFLEDLIDKYESL